MDDQPRRIGLALGGGGGKGSAHIGVLSALEALQTPIDVLAGTSIGGLVASLYAVGYAPIEIEQWFQRATARHILERDATNAGFLGTRKIELLLREAFGERTFADVRIPLALVAVDIVRGSEVVLREGPLATAVLATTAIPGLFPPVIHNERILVDGSVLNNVPVDVAHALGAQRVIAVDLGVLTEDFAFEPHVQSGIAAWSPRRLVPRSQFLLADRALAIMIARITEQRLAETPPSVLLRPILASVLPLDFTRTLEGRMIGERATFEQRARIEALRAWRREADPPQPLIDV